jgi:hypothetical protein
MRKPLPDRARIRRQVLVALGVFVVVTGSLVATLSVLPGGDGPADTGTWRAAIGPGVMGIAVTVMTFALLQQLRAGGTGWMTAEGRRAYKRLPRTGTDTPDEVPQRRAAVRWAAATMTRMIYQVGAAVLLVVGSAFTSIRGPETPFVALIFFSIAAGVILLLALPLTVVIVSRQATYVRRYRHLLDDEPYPASAPDTSSHS